NNRVITVSDVLGSMGPVRQRLSDTYSGPELEKKVEEAYQKTLDMLIERALILEDFARQEKKLPEQIVDGRINEIIHDRFNNSRTAFFSALTEERLTLDEWRQQARDFIIVAMLRRQEVLDKVVVTPGAIQALYQKRSEKYRVPEKVHLRAIVLRAGSTNNLEQFAAEVRMRISAGEKFEELAKQYSLGAGSTKGGDWDWVLPGELRKELKAAVDQLKPGQVSAPVRMDDDFYLLKLEERQTAGMTPLDKNYAEVEGDLREKEAERIYKDWIQRLKGKYYVKIFPLK
ncbi:MAG: peptidyl-prolyl cis-trans isomerase, partial [Kiritimatiellaeota bacterium]|nr:peptidyl-prolyl cis-trans isomerase [Kiritimatiellota bacterium]